MLLKILEKFCENSRLERGDEKLADRCWDMKENA